jgi:hypothetical protein
MSKLPKILLDFASAPSLQDWENHDFLTLKPDTTLGKVLVKKGHEFDPVVSSPPLDWQPLRYHELVVQLHPESFIYIKVSDEIGEEHTLLYSSAILFGMNQWKEFHVPLGKDVSDGKWHSLIIDIPRYMEQAQWPGFAKVDCLRLRGEVALARIRGCDDEDSLIEPATDSPYVFPFPVLRMSKLPQILLDFASNPPLQGWGNSDSLTLEYDDTLGKRVLMKKGNGFEQAVSSPPCDWQPLQYYELTVRLHPESVICINVSDKRGKDRTLLYSATRPSELNQWKEFHVPLGKDVSDGNWYSLMIDIPKHMEQAQWPGFVKVNWLRLRGEVVLAGIRGCDDEDPLRESAIASPYSVVVPSSKDPAKFVPYVINNNRIDLVDTEDLLEVARSPQHGLELMLWLSVEDPDKASAMIEEIGPELLLSLSDSPQDVHNLFSDLEAQSPSVGKWLASKASDQFATNMKRSPGDWRETQLIFQRLRNLGKVYDFFEHFVAPSETKENEDIRPIAELISGGILRSGIFQHPPVHGESILPYPPISVSDYIKLWLDFYIGILDERPGKGQQQTRFDELCEGDSVQFGVRINGKRVRLPGSMLNVVGWKRRCLPIELPTDGELVVEFITDAMGDLKFNWAAWGEPRLLGVRAVQVTSEDSAITPSLLGTGNRWAVLVGVNEYEDKANYGQLHVCVRDVGAIYERLIAGGLDPARIRLLTDDKSELPTRENILVSLKSIADATEPDDLLLFYYSGHGDEEGGEGYLVARNGRRLVLRDTAVPISRVKEIMEQASARAKVIILDACHSGADIGGKGPKLMSAEFIRRVFQQAEGLAILSSCKQGQLSYEWRENERSVFTYFLLEAFTGEADRDEKGFVTVQDANRHVTNGVKLWASQRNLSQTPTLQYTVAGDIILIRNLGSG